MRVETAQLIESMRCKLLKRLILATSFTPGLRGRGLPRLLLPRRDVCPLKVPSAMLLALQDDDGKRFVDTMN
jgi:hypothetical protein